MFAHHMFCATNIEAHMRNSGADQRGCAPLQRGRPHGSCAVEPPNYSSWWTMGKDDKELLKNRDSKINYKEAARNKRRIIIQTCYNADETCAICLNNMKNTSVKFIPCGHVFHNECLNKLMMSRCQSKNNCPHCRALIKISEESESEWESEEEWGAESGAEEDEVEEDEVEEDEVEEGEVVLVEGGAPFTAVFAEEAVVFAETRWEDDRAHGVEEPAYLFAETRWDDRAPEDQVVDPAGMFEFNEEPDHG